MHSQEFDSFMMQFVASVIDSGGVCIIVNYVTYRAKAERRTTFDTFDWMASLDGMAILLEWTYNSKYLSLVNSTVRFKYDSDDFKVYLDSDGNATASCNCEFDLPPLTVSPGFERQERAKAVGLAKYQQILASRPKTFDLFQTHQHPRVESPALVYYLNYAWMYPRS